MEIINLMSGSKGNCTYININNQKMLIDVGTSMKQINQGLLINGGIDLDDINVILITHSHSDHIHSFLTIYKKYPNIKFMMAKNTFHGIPNDDNARGLLERLPYDYDMKRIIFLDDNETKEGKSAIVTAFKLNHDEYCQGYIIKDKSNDETICFISDNGGYLDTDVNLKGHTYYLTESNYDRNMLVFDPIRNEKLKRRVLGKWGHTDNYQAISNLTHYVTENTKGIMFTHLSEDCNTEELARATHQEYLSIWGKRTLFKNIIIKYARQHEATEME